MKAKENPIYNLGFNIILPLIVLNKGQEFIYSILAFIGGSFSNDYLLSVFFSSKSAPIYTLFIALSFPFIYGLKDFVREKKINFVSLIGLISIALTGGLALLQLEGIYFAVKEAAIPLVLAFVALASIFVKKPLASLFIFKSSLFDTNLIQAKLISKNKEKDFKKLMNVSTLVLSCSFVLSAILNFIIAIFVFVDIDSHVREELKGQLINKQVADMTWMGYVFIALPLAFVTGFLLWWILKKLKALTGLGLEELVPQTRLQPK